MRADKRVGGSRGKLYRCDGAVFDVKCKAKEIRGCQALVRACWQSSTQEWKITEVSYEHTLCSGGTKNASPRALRAEAAKFIYSNTSMTASSLKNSLKSQTGCDKLSGRSASRLRKEILGTGDKEVAASYTTLDSFFEFIRDKCGGSVTDCQGRASPRRGNA